MLFSPMHVLGLFGRYIFNDKLGASPFPFQHVSESHHLEGLIRGFLNL